MMKYLEHLFVKYYLNLQVIKNTKLTNTHKHEKVQKLNLNFQIIK
jgi:hypothetical protein